MSTPPPKLRREVPAPTTDIHDRAPGDGTVVALDLINSIGGEQRIAVFRIVLLMQKATKQGKGAAGEGSLKPG